MVRYNYDRIDVASNATEINEVAAANIMIYPNGLLMGKIIKDTKNPRASNLVYTKHYYIGSERISAKIGTSTNLGLYPQQLAETAMPQISHPVVRDPSDQSVQDAGAIVAGVYEKFNQPVPANNFTDEGNLYTNTHENIGSTNYFYFHPDHLGSSSYITNKAGVVSQHMEYLPFGETLVDEHLNSYNSTFKYNGKEFDAETGNYYYGARYYDPKWSIFISVDPLAEKTPDWTPYRYGFNNPVRYTDPTGMFEDEYGLNQHGNVSFLRKTNDEQDKLIILDINDKETSNSITVDKGILNNKSIESAFDKDKNAYTFEMHTIKDDAKANELFDFVTSHTLPEWSLTKIGETRGDKGTSVLSTTCNTKLEAGGSWLLVKGYNITHHSHNHTTGSRPSNPDMNFAKSLNAKFPNAVLDIYFNKEYFPYNQDGKIISK